MKWVTLGSLANVTSGGTPDRQRPEFWGGDVPWVKTTLIQNCEINREDIDETITEAGLKKSSSRIIPAGSVLLAMIGQGRTRGQVALLRTDAAINQNCAALVLKAGVDARYVYQQLLFRYDELRNASNSSGQQNLNAQLIRSFKLPDLHPEAQVRVGAILASWDAAIEKTERLIAATAKRHESLLIRLLGRRLWASSQHERADVLFTPISERNRPELPVLAVTQDQGVVPRSTLDRRIAMDLSDPATFKVVRKDDFVISLRSFQGGLEHSAYEGLVSPAYTVLRCRAGVEPAFYRHYLKSPDFLKRLSVAVVGIRDGKQINFADFASIQLPLPVRPKQASLAAALDASEAELAVVKRQADALRSQKRGLMQKLLTGQWRLPAPAISPEECSSC